MIKKHIYICFICILYSCLGQTKKENKIMDNEELVVKFKKQKCRLEFREHQLFYNDIEIKVDQPLSYYEEIFGKDYKRVSRGRVIDYKNLPISLNKGMDSIVGAIRIEVYYYDQQMKNHFDNDDTYGYPPYILDEQYVLIDGIAVNKNTDPVKLNQLLVDNNKVPFTSAVRSGSNSIKRQYINGDDYQEYIYI